WIWSRRPSAPRLPRTWSSPRDVALLGEPLLQMHGDEVALTLADRFADVSLHWQLVCAVAHRHERAEERMPVDRAHLHQPARAEVLHRVGHHDICPAALRRALLQARRELSVRLHDLPALASRSVCAASVKAKDGQPFRVWAR